MDSNTPAPARGRLRTPPPRSARARSGGGAPLTAIALALLFAATPAIAQDRPPEEDLFGGAAKKPSPDQPAPTTKPEGAPTTPAGPATKGGAEGESAHAPPAAEQAVPASGEAGRDQSVLGSPDSGPKLSEEAAPENPLTIGGQFYMRAQTSGREKQDPKNWSVSSPSLVDGYFDARPNPRVRAFLLTRMQFDPMLQQGLTGLPGGFDSGQGAMATLSAPVAHGPQLALDQLWIRFDIKRTVFVTAGRQHVRWGTARFWTPTDFLHLRHRNPLDVFDARTGTSMLKLHLPWESKGWNFYAYGVTESNGPTLGSIAGAARAEMVLGTSELGLGALVQRGHKPKLAADLSTGIWDFDLYGELALRYGSEIDLVNYAPVPGTSVFDPTNYPTYKKSGIKPQATGGLSWAHKYNDNDLLTVGAEYFYNSLGYAEPTVYPGLIAPRNPPLSEPPAFFYLGRQYAALFVSLPAPYSWDLHTFTLSTLGNFSDQSFISRFDYALTLLTHLRFEAFVAVHYGHSNGEFRLGFPSLGVRPSLLDLGVALRVAL
jgi:hypothetical protein